MRRSDAKKVGTKRRNPSPKVNRSTECERFLWHLRPPYDSKFDRSPWWESTFKVSPIAALYELARRDPRVGRAISHRKPLAHVNTPSLHFLARVGLKSWQKLTAQERLLFKGKVGSMKGLDFRSSNELCALLTRLAYQDAKPLGGDDTAVPDNGDLERAIAERAVQAHRQGYLIFALAHNLPKKRAVFEFSRLYRLIRKTYAIPGHRGRWEDWLPLISRFEKAEICKEKDTNQLFIRYQRLFANLRFE